MRHNREENQHHYNHRAFDDRHQQYGHNHFYDNRERYHSDRNYRPDYGYDTSREPGYDRIGGDGDVSHNPNKYKVMYDTANYSDMPRTFDYGLPYGTENNDLSKIERFPDDYEPRNYRYSEGYNPNYDNPEEGDMYRNFDSRGNHGYRHDAAYGNQDEFLDFGNDHYGRPDQTGNTRDDRYMRRNNRW